MSLDHSISIRLNSLRSLELQPVGGFTIAVTVRFLDLTELPYTVGCFMHPVDPLVASRIHDEPHGTGLAIAWNSLWDSYGNSIAVTNRSRNHSLFAHLITCQSRA